MAITNFCSAQIHNHLIMLQTRNLSFPLFSARSFTSLANNATRNLSIRTANISDKSFVTKSVLNLIQIGENLPRVPEVKGIDKCYDEMLNDPEHCAIFVAEDNSTGKRLGAAIVTFQNALHLGGKYSYLQELVIDPSARGLGVGSKLLEKIEENAKSKGMIAVSLSQPPSTSKYDAERSKFYMKNGYESTCIARMKLFRPFFTPK